MFGLSQSWALARESWRVVRADREILLFPLMGAIGMAVVAVLFAIPLAMSGLPEALNRGDNGAIARGLIVLYLFLFCQNVVVLFSQSALVGAAMIRLRGGDPTLGDGFRAAASRSHAILGYAAISATIGLVLHVLDMLARSWRERDSESGNVGGVIASIVASILIGLVGAAWSVATYFVVPVMIVEGVGPMEGIRRSVRLIKDVWGESAVVSLGMGLLFVLIYLAIGVVGIGLGVALVAANLTLGGLLLIAATVVAIMVAALIQSALKGVFVAALYRYAVDGAGANAYFDQRLLRTAFAPA
jgi:hypothetical protein